MILQKLLISYLLKPLGKLMDKLPQILKDIMFIIGGLALLSISFLQTAGFLPYRYLYLFAAGCLCLGIMILSSLTGNIRPVKFHKLLSIFWFMAGIFSFLSAFLCSIDYLTSALFLLVISPVLFIVWNQGSFHKILRLLSITMVIALIATIIVNALFYPMTVHRYAGLFTNQNATVFFYGPAFAVLLVSLYANPKFTWKSVGCILLLGAVSALVYYSNSRTGQLTLIVEFALCTLVYLAANIRSIVKIVLLKILPLALVVMISIPNFLYVMQLKPLIENKIHQLQLEAMQTDPPETTPPTSSQETTQPTIGETVPPVTTPPVTTPPVTIPVTPPNEIQSIDGFDYTNDKKHNTEGKDFDAITTGRLTIWKAYASQLNLFGHKLNSLGFLEEVGMGNKTAHMTVLQYAYDSGILCGLGFLLFNLYAGVMSIIYAWKHRKDAISLLPMTLSVGFGVISAISSVGTPFLYICTMYYVFVQAPLITKRTELED